MDQNGWAYGTDFSLLPSPPPPGARKPGIADVVRRRRRVRRRRPVGLSAAASGRAGQAPGRRTAADGKLGIKSRNVLGVAAPGEAMPLPYDWQRAGEQCALRRLKFAQGCHDLDSVLDS